MTRRQALAALGACVAAHPSTAVLQWRTEPGTLRFDLRTFTSYTFTEGDRTVTVTPQELMDALAHTHTFNPSSHVVFRIDGVEVGLCLTCGELVRKR